MARRLFKGFKAAWDGFKNVLVFESSFRTMVVVAILVIIAMFYFPTNRAEKAVLLTTIFAVLGLELVNSVIERVLDFIELKHHVKVKTIKDLMAAIVLLASLGAAIIGLLIFWPHIFGI